MRGHSVWSSGKGQSKITYIYIIIMQRLTAVRVSTQEFLYCIVCCTVCCTVCTYCTVCYIVCTYCTVCCTVCTYCTVCCTVCTYNVCTYCTVCCTLCIVYMYHAHTYSMCVSHEYVLWLHGTAYSLTWLQSQA